MDCHVDRHLLPFKLFYFFFYGGQSCVRPFLPHYLHSTKGLSAAEATSILGAVPFLSLIAKPLIGHAADAARLHRPVLLGNLLVALLSFSALLLAPPLPHRAPLSPSLNSSDPAADLLKSTGLDGSLGNWSNGSEPLPSAGALVEEDAGESSFGRAEFWLLFGLIVVGNVGGLKSAYSLADALTLSRLSGAGRLGDYGRQRMWMAPGLGLALLSVSLAMDFGHFAQAGAGAEDYRPAFAAFAACLLAAAATVPFLSAPELQERPCPCRQGRELSASPSLASPATQKSPLPASEVLLEDGDGAASDSEDSFFQSTAGSLSDEDFQTPESSPKRSARADTSGASEGSAGLWAVLPLLLRAEHAWFLAMSVVLGMNLGTSTWLTPFYLKTELLRSQTGIGLAVVAVCGATMAASFVSGKVLAAIGPQGVQGVCLWLYAVRGWLWWAGLGGWGWAGTLGVELLLGAAIGLWLPALGAAAEALGRSGGRASAVAVLSGVYDGVGVGTGALVSGRLYASWGGRGVWALGASFTAVAAAVHCGVLLVRRLRRRKGVEQSFA